MTTASNLHEVHIVPKVSLTDNLVTAIAFFPIWMTVKSTLKTMYNPLRGIFGRSVPISFRIPGIS